MAKKAVVIGKTSYAVKKVKTPKRGKVRKNTVAQKGGGRGG